MESPEVIKILCDCDVADKESLALFRASIIKWQEILAGEDQHSIYNQIQDIIWNDNVYRTFNEARRISAETNDSSTGLAGTLIELIDQMFITHQSMAIRRLIDDYEWRPERSVCSLPRLLNEVEHNRSLFTRENYICYDGLPFDGKRLSWRDRLLYDHRQKTFDILSRRNESHRTREDRLSSEIFPEINKQLKKAEKIRVFANKFIAHAADPGNRHKIDPILKDITLQHFEDTYETLVAIGKYFERLFGKLLLTEFPTAKSDQLENWDKPMIISTDKNKLYDYWDERRQMFDSWSRNK
jgi:hypothetical protein